MKPADLGELILLAAIWGASFLFLRLGAAEFGAVPLSGLRVAGASLVLLPILIWRKQLGALRAHWKPIFVVGVTNSALPFLCFSYAALSINAGLSSIFNAAAPLFGALIGWLWLNSTLKRLRVMGLVIGFVGVFGLAWNKGSGMGAAGVLGSVGATGTPGGSAALAVGACIVATVCYGFSVNFTKRYLAEAPPMAVAAGSQLGAAIALAVPTLLLWPAAPPASSAWGYLAILAVVCTGLAYVLFFRLIANTGPSNAIAVTFLIPAFGVAWGAVFLDEQVTGAMMAGCVVILIGTALATGVLAPRLRRAQ
ncbi:MAG: membrane protein [Methylibium sp. NZG]|nr:MAG: membrane protein [Methylibium sp. NZG]